MTSDRLSILVVEDICINMKLIEIILSKIYPKAIVSKARNGKEALDLYKKDGPDLILMDIKMPEMDGIEATIKIRELEKGTDKRTPIVAVTAGVLQKDRERCLEAGVDGFVAKPIELESFAKVIRGFVDSL